MQYAQFLQWAVTKEAALLWQILHSSAASESSQNIKKSVYQLIALSPDIHFLSLATELLTKIWMGNGDDFLCPLPGGSSLQGRDDTALKLSVLARHDGGNSCLPYI